MVKLNSKKKKTLMLKDTFITTTFDPTDIHFSQIKDWLLDEKNKKDEGFYCNIDIIENSFRAKLMLVVLDSNEAVGFGIWRETFDYCATIQIIETHPRYRRKGLGKIIMNVLFEMFLSKNIYALYVQCISKKSEAFCKKLGFLEIPTEIDPSNIIEEEKKLYKILIKHAPLINSSIGSESIEISKDGNIFKWDVLYLSNSKRLELPIIYPIHRYWDISWTKNQKIIYNGNVQNFKSEIYFCEFLVILKLP